MTAQITFRIIDGEGRFDTDAAYDQATEKFDAVLDRWDSGHLTEPQYANKLKSLLEEHPNLIDAHAHLGAVWFEQGKYALALEPYMQGFSVGQAVMPPDFSGEISWGWMENRPFLRAAHGLMLCHLHQGQRAEALKLMEQLLEWNPSDNQGVRFILGSERLRAGDVAAAKTILADNAEDYPPHQYEWALAHLISGDFVKAATSLRRGFCTNGYIAEVLLGSQNPIPLPIWHSSNLAEVSTAQEYAKEYGRLWSETEGALPFLRWLHNSSAVLAERAAYRGRQESLFLADDFTSRGIHLDHMERCYKGIDDTLSKDLAARYEEVQTKLDEAKSRRIMGF